MRRIKMIAGAILAVAALGLTAAARADDPSLHEVYQAVHDGHLGDAQAMMEKVLKDHPDSAKAHYVEAEVLARMDRSDEARSELERAESLAPGLSFAKPEAVRELRTLISDHGRIRLSGAERLRSAGSEPRTSASEFPWGIVLIVAGAGIALLLFLRARRAAVVPMGGTPGTGPLAGPGQYGTPYGTPYGGAPMGGSGLGSSIVGGLATGAAVGAGMVAGEALAHELMGNRERDRFVSSDDGSRIAYDDGGGQDFGVSGADSWDSGGGDIAGGDLGGGGGDDWS